MARTLANPSASGSLSGCYDVVNVQLVNAAINRHPELSGALARAPELVRKHFSPAGRLVLEGLQDPDAEGDDPDLTVLIDASPLTDEEALARLDALNDEWEHHEDLPVAEKLAFDIVFS